MAKITLSGNVSGSAVFTLQAPATNTNRTLALPDADGDVLLSSSDLTAQVKTATSASGTAPIYSARAWVNFNGTGTVAIRAAGNVTSITDNGTGNYTVNFTNALPDANYSVNAQIRDNGASTFTGGLSGGAGLSTKTTSAVQVCSATTGGTLTDTSEFNIAIFR